ncbi:phosphate ABC transporter ATP-binding protein [Halorubrum sp. DTA98]|uniref:phosphate ABC transporter ATP-binding protein n=1 Tax=Halorubrum sp. DTA98 TaxID=3402163 RepID=UPI003AAFF7E5
MSDTVLETENLAVTYTGDRRVDAVKGIDLSVPENRLTAIIGPSGCGKSTFLKALDRLHDVQPNVEVSGEVYLRGDPVYDTGEPAPEIRRRIGYVPQEPTPLPLSIRENVAYGLRIHRLHDSKADLDARVERYLRQVDLWDEVADRLDAPAAELSTGQIQRLCLARSLAVEPDVLLCDEVTSALDPVSAENVEETLAVLAEEYTIVMVTHSMDQARRLADEVVFLYLGEIVEANDVQSFFENPRHERTKRFVSGPGTPDTLGSSDAGSPDSGDTSGSADEAGSDINEAGSDAVAPNTS